MTDNQEKNKEHYEKIYSNYNIKNILNCINDLDSFLAAATTTDTSWYALYQGDFRKKIKGKKVLEMGCGDCTNAGVMAALGAEVYANDIAASSGVIVKELNRNFNFDYPIVFVKGDFLKNDLPSGSFDYVVGKAFLHHLTIPVERQFLEESSRLLTPGGEARFFEPAVNNKFLDELRWCVPVKGRPSKLDKKAFREWKKNDPHPDRSFSSRHWKEAGKELFREVMIIPVGAIERFSRLLTNKERKAKFRRWAFKTEKGLPKFIGSSFARSQLIIYKNPVL